MLYERVLRQRLRNHKVILIPKAVKQPLSQNRKEITVTVEKENTFPFTPVQQVLLSAIRLDQSQDDRTRDLLRGDLDWPALRQMAMAHGVSCHSCIPVSSRLATALWSVIRSLVLGPIVRAYLPGVRRQSSAPAPWLAQQYRDLYRECFDKEPQEPMRMLPGRRQRLEALRSPSLAHLTGEVNQQAMAQGIELRYPLLDHRLVEFAASLPTTHTFRAVVRKIIVRNAMRGYLPDSVLNLRGKIVPTAIYHHGLKERERAKVWPLMTNMRAADMGFVDENRLRQTYQDYLDGRDERSYFWPTLMLEDWLRRYF